jgi:hypothetical protein
MCDDRARPPLPNPVSMLPSALKRATEVVNNRGNEN